MKWSFFVLFLLTLSTVVRAADFELQKGDHICIVGGTMAERMQHYGWLENATARKVSTARAGVPQLGL